MARLTKTEQHKSEQREKMAPTVDCCLMRPTACCGELRRRTAPESEGWNEQGRSEEQREKEKRGADGEERGGEERR